MEFSFPANGTGRCYNNTDCQRGGLCAVKSPSGAVYCSCPPLYDPIDQCRTFYYDRSGIIPHLINFIITFIANCILIGLIHKAIGANIKRIRRDGCKIPTPMMVTIASFLLLSITNVTITLQFVFRDPNARYVNSVGNAIFCICFVIVQYFLFVLQIKTKQLGSIQRKWRILSIFIVVCGVGGMSTTCLIGFFYRPTDLPLLGTVGTIVGLLIPVAICIVMDIYSIVWINKLDYKSNVYFSALRRLIFICLASCIWMCFTFFSLLTLTRIFYFQLAGATTLIYFVNTVQNIIAQGLSVAFIRVKTAKKKSGSGVMSTTKMATPQTSSTMSLPQASSVHGEETKEVVTVEAVAAK